MANCVQCGRKLAGFGFGKKICEWCVRHEAAKRGEEPEDTVQPVMPTPWTRGGSMSLPLSFTNLLLAANIVVYVAMVASGNSPDDSTGQDLLRWGANFGPLTFGGEWWRLFSYMFLHGSFFHIAANMWALWQLGTLCEDLYGPWTYLTVYLVTGVAGGLMSAGWHPFTPSVGASGAIMGITGALISSLYLGDLSLPRAAITPTLRMIVIITAVNLYYGFTSTRVDNGAHIGGLVSGLIFGVLIARVAPDANNISRRIAVLLAVTIPVAGAGLWLQHTRGFMGHLQRASEMLSQNKIDQAIPELEAAARKNSSEPYTHFQLGRAYAMKGNLARAEAEFHRVTELSPDEPEGYYNLGKLYMEDGKPALAKEAFTRLLAIEKNDIGGHFGLGAALAEMNDCEGAIREYQTVLKIDPKVRGASYNMGLCQFRLKRYDEAIAAYLVEQKLADDVDVESALADAYQAKGMLKQADEARQKAQQFK